MPKDDTVKRNDWPLGMVVNTFSGTGNKVRKVEVKMAKGGTCKTLLHPVTEIVLLLCSET